MKKFAVTMLVIALLAGTSSAAIVTYTLDVGDPNGPNTWEVRAAVPDGRFGIASFGIDLANTTTIENMSPKSMYYDFAASFFDVGFVALRSAANFTPIAGSQDTVSATPNPDILIYGFGQSGGDLDLQPPRPAGHSTVGLPVQPIYDAHLLLAQGTYTGVKPSFVAASANTLANVWNTDDGATTEAAQIELVVIPEPVTMLALLGGALVAVIRRR